MLKEKEAAMCGAAFEKHHRIHIPVVQEKRGVYEKNIC